MYFFKRNGYYHVEYFDKAENRIRRISTRCKQKQDAIKFLSRFEDELAERQARKLTPISLSKLRDEFLEYSKTVHTQKTLAGFRGVFSQLLGAYGDLQLCNLTRSTVDNHIEKRLKEVSAYAARTTFTYLSSVFSYAITKNYLLTNPCKGLKKPKTPQKLPVFFSKAEFQVLLTNIENQDMNDLVLFASIRD
jgi:site-specific recombinase XerD